MAHCTRCDVFDNGKEEREKERESDSRMKLALVGFFFSFLCNIHVCKVVHGYACTRRDGRSDGFLLLFFQRVCGVTGASLSRRITNDDFKKKQRIVARFFQDRRTSRETLRKRERKRGETRVRHEYKRIFNVYISVKLRAQRIARGQRIKPSVEKAAFRVKRLQFSRKNSTVVRETYNSIFINTPDKKK